MPQALKFYLISEDSQNKDIIRKCDRFSYILNTYKQFLAHIAEFPELSGKLFTIYWTDDENEEVVISSDEELYFAVQEMRSDLKKFIVKFRNPVRHIEKTGIDNIHSGVLCDGCEGSIVGYRYKCLICKNYDLCSECEKISVHSDHPMLRIPNPFFFERIDIYKIMHFFSSFTSSKYESKHSHHRRRHSHHQSDSRKKGKCEKRDSGPETGEESDENRCRKYSHKKCVYNQLMTDFFRNFEPTEFSTEENLKAQSQGKTNEATGMEQSHLQNLKSVIKTFVSFLNPLGIDVDVEVRPGHVVKEKQKETEKKENDETPVSTWPAPPQAKGVRFATPEKSSESADKKIEEITRIWANQKMNESPEDNGWVSFEELERDSEEPQPSTSTGAIPNLSAREESTLQTEKTTQGTKNLYPTLNNEQQIPVDNVVSKALEEMLSMGFTNEGNWLTHLLQAKNGNISEVLEVLAPHKK